MYSVVVIPGTEVPEVCSALSFSLSTFSSNFVALKTLACSRGVLMLTRRCFETLKFGV